MGWMFTGRGQILSQVPSSPLGDKIYPWGANSCCKIGLCLHYFFVVRPFCYATIMSTIIRNVPNCVTQPNGHTTEIKMGSMLWSQFSAIFDNFGRKIGVFLKNQCHDHNFLRFSTIFGEKIGVFLKTNVMITIFAKTCRSLSKKRQYFR
jgi:hypothetical protein